jgi:hypothetical protein
MDEMPCPLCGGFSFYDLVQHRLRKMGIELLTDLTMDTKSAATYLNRSPQTLENLRHLKQGPVYSKDATGRVRYHIDDLRGWSEGFVPDLYDPSDTQPGGKLEGMSIIGTKKLRNVPD